MSNHSTNQERTEEYLKKFDREKTLKYLIKNTHPIIFDVGANVGSTLGEFKEWYPNSTVHCFEPQEECWESLEKQASQYTTNEAIINKRAAGSVSNVSATFYSHDITSGQSGFNKINTKSLDSVDLNKLSDSEAIQKYEETLNHEREVEIIRSDDYMDSSGIEHVDLLKIDTQGYEEECLKGIENEFNKIKIILTEIMFYDLYTKSLSFYDLEKYLIPNNFKIYDISHISKNPMNGRLDWVDAIYKNMNYD